MKSKSFFTAISVISFSSQFNVLIIDCQRLHLHVCVLHSVFVSQRKSFYERKKKARARKATGRQRDRRT